MKTKNTIIFLLVIGITVLGVLYFNKCNQDSYRNSLSQLEDIYPNEDGCFNINESGENFDEDSLEYIREIIRNRSRLPFNQIYGYQIDIKYIKEMYKAIVHFDSIHERDEEPVKVGGVRIYEAISERKIEGEMKRKADLVMLPYLSNGKDVFEVDPQFLATDFRMYAHFRPCPKLCSSMRLYIHQKKPLK